MTAPQSTLHQNAMIFKILRTSEWKSLQESGRFEGSPDDARDGFIHFSSVEHIKGTLTKHFASEQEVVIVSVATSPLGDALKWEASRGGALFPHLYRALALGEVQDARSVRRTNGTFDVPDLSQSSHHNI